MQDSCPDGPKAPSEAFDYSTPEAQAALEGVSDLVLEIRNEIMRPMRLYERTLGLAVIPVLLRRSALGLYRKLRRRRQGIR